MSNVFNSGQDHKFAVLVRKKGTGKSFCDWKEKQM
jgi:hypothetical protein